MARNAKKKARLSAGAKKFIRAKIRILIREGRKQKQAIRIAYELARKRGFSVPAVKNPAHMLGVTALAGNPKAKRAKKGPSRKTVKHLLHVERALQKRLMKLKAESPSWTKVAKKLYRAIVKTQRAVMAIARKNPLTGKEAREMLAWSLNDMRWGKKHGGLLASFTFGQASTRAQVVAQYGPKRFGKRAWRLLKLARKLRDASELRSHRLTEERTGRRNPLTTAEAERLYESGLYELDESRAKVNTSEGERRRMIHRAHKAAEVLKVYGGSRRAKSLGVKLEALVMRRAHGRVQMAAQRVKQIRGNAKKPSKKAKGKNPLTIREIALTLLALNGRREAARIVAFKIRHAGRHNETAEAGKWARIGGALRKIRTNPTHMLGVTALVNAKKSTKKAKKKPVATTAAEWIAWKAGSLVAQGWTAERARREAKKLARRKGLLAKKNPKVKKESEARRAALKRIRRYGDLPAWAQKKWRKAALLAARRDRCALEDVPVVWGKSTSRAPHGLLHHGRLVRLLYEFEKGVKSPFSDVLWDHKAGDGGKGKKRRPQTLAIDPVTRHPVLVSRRGSRPGFSSERGLLY